MLIFKKDMRRYMCGKKGELGDRGKYISKILNSKTNYILYAVILIFLALLYNSKALHDLGKYSLIIEGIVFTYDVGSKQYIKWLYHKCRKEKNAEIIAKLVKIKHYSRFK